MHRGWIASALDRRQVYSFAAELPNKRTRCMWRNRARFAAADVQGSRTRTKLRPDDKPNLMICDSFSSESPSKISIESILDHRKLSLWRESRSISRVSSCRQCWTILSRTLTNIRRHLFLIVDRWPTRKEYIGTLVQYRFSSLFKISLSMT